jgi:hypothetical protein
MKEYKFILTEQKDGRWFGRIDDRENAVDEDGTPVSQIYIDTGNDIDCCLNSMEEALLCLYSQLKEYLKSK